MHDLQYFRQMFVQDKVVPFQPTHANIVGMEITWQELAKGFQSQAHFTENYSDLYHALYRWIAAAAEARQNGEGLTAAQQAFVSLIEESWDERTIRGATEASLLVPAAVHAAVLAEDEAAENISRFYATVGGHFNNDTAVFEKALGTLFQNPGEILGWFLREGRIQTNEISRAITWLVPAYVFSAWQPDLTISLVELGTSSGLLLSGDYQNWQWALDNQHTYTVNDAPYLMKQAIFSDDHPAFHQLYQAGKLPPLPITRRVGFDLHPLDIHNEADRLILEACLWGDQPERLTRFREAVQGYKRLLQGGQSVNLYQGNLFDALPLLPNLIPADVKAPHLLLVYNSAVTVYMGDAEYEQLRNAMIVSLNNLPDGVIGLWLENEAPRHNEAVDHEKYFLLKARTPFLSGMSTIFLAEQEAHPTNMYLRGGWDSLRGILGF